MVSKYVILSNNNDITIVLVLDQQQATVKSPPVDRLLDVSTIVSTIAAKTTYDTQEHQVSTPNHPVDDASRSDLNSIGSIEKKSDSFYTKEKELVTGMHMYAYVNVLLQSISAQVLPESQDQLTSSTNISSSSPDEQEKTLTMPTQVVDDDIPQSSSETVSYEKHCMVVCGKVQRGVGDTSMYLHYEEKESHYKRALSQKDIQHKMELQFKNDTIYRVTEQCAQLLRQKATQTQCQTGPILEKYSMARSPHGIAVIINNYKFYSTSVGKELLPNRRGSLVDEDNLLVTLKFLNYEVRVLRNLPASDITRELMRISLESHKNYDSFVCCILSHGYLDGVYGADSDRVTFSDIANIFKGSYCRDLVDKPKLFFIQACRGQDTDTGVIKEDEFSEIDGNLLHHSLPNEADFLFGYATPPGKVSFRSIKHGSWYISSLCQVLQDNARQLDLSSMLTIVNKEVCKAYTSQGYKQCPAPVSLLRKQVWFFNT